MNNPLSYRQHRLIRAVMIGLAMAAIEHTIAVYRAHFSDFSLAWYAARAWLAHLDPYPLIGPGRQIPWAFPLLYPMPAVIVAVPFAFLSRVWADTVFVGISCAAFAYALLRNDLRNPQLLVFVSCAMVATLMDAQWSPLLSSVSALSALGFLLACKPPLGLAIIAGWPSWKTVIGAAAFGAVSIALAPWWVREWLALLPAGTHLAAPIQHPGGFLVLLALFRWRQPEARFLVAFACVPQTAVLYEAVPLFLVPRGWWQCGILAALTYAVVALHLFVGIGGLSFSAFTELEGRFMLWLLYFPCVVFVLWNGRARAEPHSPAQTKLA